MQWFFLALFDAVLWAGADLLNKFILTREVKDPLFAASASTASAAVLFVVASVFLGGISGIPLAAGLAAAGAGVTYAMAILFYYSALNKEEVSRVSSMFAIIPVFTLAIGFAFLNERFSAQTYAGVLLIVAGAFLISVRRIENSVKISQGVISVLFAAVFFAVENTLAKFASSNAGLWGIYLWMGLGAGLVSACLFLLRSRKLKAPASGAKKLFLSGAASSFAHFFAIIAISSGPVSLVSALIETTPVLVFLASAALSAYYPRIMREEISRGTLAQKAVAIALVVIGSFLLA